MLTPALSRRALKATMRASTTLKVAFRAQRAEQAGIVKVGLPQRMRQARRPSNAILHTASA
ncbi:MAG: hypothetical protein ACRDZY_05505, partial [Acidimicrobiales bacterium]